MQFSYYGSMKPIKKLRRNFVDMALDEHVLKIVKKANKEHTSEIRVIINEFKSLFNAEMKHFKEKNNKIDENLRRLNKKREFKAKTETQLSEEAEMESLRSIVQDKLKKLKK